MQIKWPRLRLPWDEFLGLGAAFGWDKAVNPTHHQKYNNGSEANQNLANAEVQPVMKTRHSRASSRWKAKAKTEQY